jgi:hypothetical protein
VVPVVVLCWLVALAVLVLWPLVRLVTLPFRRTGITFDALFTRHVKWSCVACYGTNPEAKSR